MTEEFGPYRLEHLSAGAGWARSTAPGTPARAHGRAEAAARPARGRPEFQARFRRESALAAQLSEPHIIPIHDFGEINGRLFIDMRLVDGTDLASVIKSEGRWRRAAAIGILARWRARGRRARGGLVHRDVKPSNVLVRGHDEDEFAYLIDFGIARPPPGRRAGPRSRSRGPPSARSTTWRPSGSRTGPWTAGRRLLARLHAVRAAHRGGAVPRAHAGRDDPTRTSRWIRRGPRAPPGLPPGLDDVVVRGMAKRPEQR
jgi:serine/threonine-protein kinase